MREQYELLCKEYRSDFELAWGLQRTINQRLSLVQELTSGLSQHALERTGTAQELQRLSTLLKEAGRAGQKLETHFRRQGERFDQLLLHANAPRARLDDLAARVEQLERRNSA